MRVLVTGASGFVGRALLPVLAERGQAVRAAVRRPHPSVPADAVAVGDIDGQTEWSRALDGVDCVVHLAARVHVMHDNAASPLAEFRRVNVAGTVQLARAAARAGVRRLIFVSSIKVNGERTNGRPLSEEDTPVPIDAYGVSKWEAEQALHGLSWDTGLEVVILRPPLVYGPGVKANFQRLLSWVNRGLPLPFGAIENRRSLLYLGNLTAAISNCADHPAAANQTFLLSDGEDLSTAELVRRLACAMNRPSRLIPVPKGLIELAGRLSGKQAEVERLLGSLCVDSGKIRHVLGWRPPYSVDEGLRRTAEWFKCFKDSLTQ